MNQVDYELLEKRFNRLNILYYQCQQERDELRNKVTTTNKWLKLSDLPNDFWQECFVSTYDGVDILTEINWVKVANNKAFWYSETELEWFSFRPDIEARICAIEYPKIAEEDFK